MVESKLSYNLTEQGDILNAYSRALGREAHILTQHPDLTWQQLYNRLQWEDEKTKQTLVPELEKRMISRAKPWLKQTSHLEESKEFIRIFYGHKDLVTCCVFSPDGSKIVSSSTDTTIKVWDPGNGIELITMSGHTSPVLACAISHDGRMVLSASADRTLKIWAIDSGVEIMTLSGHRDQVTDCAFSPDGRTVISSSWDKTIKIWDVSSGNVLKTLHGHTEPVNAIALNSNGSLIASASDDKTVKVWNIQDGTEIATLAGHKDFVTDCAFSPDGQKILSACFDKTLKIWDAENFSESATIKASDSIVTTCIFSPDGNLIISAGRDRIIKFWDAANLLEYSRLVGHTQYVSACAFSPDGRMILSAGLDHTLRLWKVNRIANQLLPVGHDSAIMACEFSPDGRYVFSADSEHTVKVWDAENGVVYATHPGDTEFEDGFMKVTCGTSPDDQVTFSVPAKLWAFASNIEKFHLGLLDSSAKFHAISPNGNIIASAGADKTIKLWDTSNHDIQATIVGHKDSVLFCTFSPDGKYLASTSSDCTVKIWDLATLYEVRTLGGHSDWVNCCAFSPSGDTIVSASSDRTLKIWDAATGTEKATLVGHTRRVTFCAFSSDGRYIVSSSLDHMLKFWDAESGVEIFNYATLGSLNSCAINSPGNKVSCGGYGGNLYIFEIIGISAENVRRRVDAMLSAQEKNAHIKDAAHQKVKKTNRNPLFNKRHKLVSDEAKARRLWYFNILGIVLALLLSAGAYSLTSISPWLWILAGIIFLVSLFIIGVSIFIEIYACPHCGKTTGINSSKRGDYECRKCKGRFKL